MNNNEDLLKLIAAQQEEEPVNVKEFLFKLLRYWYWFVIAGAVGLAGAYYYTRYAPPSYAVKSLLLVKETKADGINLDNLFDNFSGKSNVKIENHIGILTSFQINRQVVENLGWHVSWFRERPLGDFSLYGKEPFRVDVEPDAVNTTGIPLFIHAFNDGTYRVKADGVIAVNGVGQPVKFEQAGIFGQQFRNEFFNFTLHTNGSPSAGEVYFHFNDLDKLALAYQKKLRVSSFNKNADLIKIELEGQSPMAEVNYLDELTNVYIGFGMKEKNLTSENTIRFIDQQLSAIVDTLKISSDNFSKYRADNKVFDLGQKASLVVEKLVQLDSKKSLAQMQLNYYENLSAYLDNAEKIKKMIAPSVVGITDASLNNLIGKLVELYGKKEALSYSLQNKNPGIQLVDKELEYTKASLAENLKNLVYNTKQELQSIQKEIGAMNEQLGNYPRTEQDLINIKRMVDLNNELYTFLLQKRAEAEITRASNIPDVKVIDPASRITSVKTRPKVMMSFLLAFMLAMAVPFAIIMIRDYFDDTLHSKEEIQKLTNVPVVGNIAHSDFQVDKIPVISHPRSVLTESLRELRTNLDYLYRGKEAVVIGVQSVVPGEGKTFISLNLAAIMAMNNRKVILIGADMRKPTLHKLLDVDNHEGLSTYLIGHHFLEQVIKPTAIENLDILPSGPVPPNPAELLGTREFDYLIAELKKTYQTIVIDNSPVSLVTDGAIVERHTNIDLFITRQGYTHKSLIDFINQMTQRNKHKKAGIVLNDIKVHHYGGYSYRYGGYYRKSYYGKGSGYFDEGTGRNKKTKPKNKTLQADLK